LPEACPVYRPRKPHLTPHYPCIQDHFETLEQVYPQRFEKHFGFWPACACAHADRGTHVPQRRQQSVKYYGRYANSTRGRLRKRQHVDPIPTVLEPPISSEAFRRNWARLIQKVFEVDPLVCSHCQGRLRPVSFIQDALVIRRILEHLGLWLANRRPQPKAHSPPALRSLHEDSYSQLPTVEEEEFSQVPPPQWDC